LPEVAGLLQPLLPPGIVAVETRADVLDAPLFADEERALGAAVEKRRREFVTGRACARIALSRLGRPPTAVRSGARGEPLWPPGVRGSITHCRGYRACAATVAPEVLALGIDAEPHAPLPPAILGVVATARERRWARTRPAGLCLDRLLFSAKEAIYKAWYPLVGVSLDFDGVELDVDLGDATFSGRVLVPAPVVAGRPLTELRGRWHADGELIVTAVIVPAA
jgi:4'-phosphopantetheinyl transferase EntD